MSSRAHPPPVRLSAERRYAPPQHSHLFCVSNAPLFVQFAHSLAQREYALMAVQPINERRLESAKFSGCTRDRDAAFEGADSHEAALSALVALLHTVDDKGDATPLPDGAVLTTDPSKPLRHLVDELDSLSPLQLFDDWTVSSLFSLLSLLTLFSLSLSSLSLLLSPSLSLCSLSLFFSASSLSPPVSVSLSFFPRRPHAHPPCVVCLVWSR